MASAATVQQLIDYYVNCLIIQYHDRPKAKATIELFARAIAANGITFDVRDGYNLNTAVGKQLDVLGKYIGVDRLYTEENYDGFFSFIEYDEVTSPPASRIGFSNYSDFETKAGTWLIYPFVLTQKLSLVDDDYRVLLRLKIAQNHIDHSHKSIDDTMFRFFNTSVFADSVNDMSMVYFVPFKFSAILRAALQKAVLPKPVGVQLQYLIPRNEDYFGFAEYSVTPPLIEGFATYADYDSKAGDTLNFNDLT